MKRPARLAYALAGLLALVAVAPSAHAQPSRQAATAEDAVDDFVSEDAAASEEARAENPEVARIEELRAEIAANREAIQELDAAAEGAEGEDLVAVRAKALQTRLDSMSRLRELVDAVVELEASGADTKSYTEQLSGLLPRVTPALREHLGRAEEELETLKKQREEAPPEERAALQQQIDRQNALVSRLLSAIVDNVEMMDALAIDAPEAKEFATQRLGERARIASGRIELATAELADAEKRLAAAPDDAAIKSEAQSLRSRRDSDTELLSSELALMDRLGMGTAEYRQLLIQATGEITADVFDAQVARGLVSGWIDSARESLIQNGPAALFKTVVFLLVIFVFWVLSRFVRKVTARAVEAPHLRFSRLLKRMIVTLASGAVLALGVLVGLSQLGIEVAPLLAGLGIAGFIVGFALQDTLANFAAGVMILAYRPYDVGDLIDCAGGVFGKVSHMNLVSTTILTVDNQTKVVPNGKIWGDVITNVTAQTQRRVDLVFGISYTDDIPHAEEVMWSVVKEHPKILQDPAPVIKLHELGDSSVNFVVRPWAARDDYWDVYWDLTREVKLRFDREGISIPFPQRDVHFHPHVNGGAVSVDDAATLGSGRTAPTGRGEADAT